MIKSMTGYGRGKFENEGRNYTVEIKTVNHRYNDITIKMPRYLNFLEDTLRQYISKSISRGKTDVYVALEDLSGKGRVITVDKNLAKLYVEKMRDMVVEYHVPDDITAVSLMKMPDIITVNNEQDESIYWEELKNATDIAIENINKSRELEGTKLKEDIHTRLNTIEKTVLEIEVKSKDLLKEYKTKLENRLKELDANKIIDESRLGMEVVLFADKSSICEEVTRLKSHISTMREMLESVKPIGKKIDFLVQEMNREINTIGSKANSLSITNFVVDTKNEIENIREQIQNIE